jgi:hypothetical protein
MIELDFEILLRLGWNLLDLDAYDNIYKQNFLPLKGN